MMSFTLIAETMYIWIDLIWNMLVLKVSGEKAKAVLSTNAFMFLPTEQLFSMLISVTAM